MLSGLSGGLVVAGGIHDQFAQEFAGGGVDDADVQILDLADGLRRGFGSVRVRATIGSSTWTTSIFPSSGAGYVLPVKRSIRVAEALDVGDVVTVTVELIDLAPN